MAAPKILEFATRVLAEGSKGKTASDQKDVLEFLAWLGEHNKDFGDILKGGDSDGMSQKLVDVVRDMPSKFMPFLNQLSQELQAAR